MTIATRVKETIRRQPPGQVFGYEVFDDYQSSPQAVMQAVGRCVDQLGLKRVSKGRFYNPEQGVLGPMSISDGALLRDALYREGKRCAYVTGPALYNRLGLTTQVPKTVSIATNRPAKLKDFGTFRIKSIARRAPITEANVPLLELLDVLRDAKKVPDTSIDTVINSATEQLGAMNEATVAKLQRLAVQYYNAATRALLGTLLETLGRDISPKLRASINPTSRFELGLDLDRWANARTWNIQ